MTHLAVARFAMIAALVLLPMAGNGQGAPTSAPRPETLEIPAPPGTSRDGVYIQAPAPQARTVTLPPSIDVRTFRITGLYSVPIDDAIAVLAPWTARTLAPTDLQRAVDALTAFIRSRDLLVAEAYLPEQDFRDGVVEIAVFEGRLGRPQLQLAPDLRVRPAVVERFVESLRAGDTLRGDNLEQSLLLLNDLPGIRVDASLAPGAQAGLVDLLATVENDGNPLTARVAIDNAGLRVAGEYRTDATLRWRSPLGLGDLLNLRLLASHTGGQKLGSLTYGLPINGHGTRIGLRMSEQSYRLAQEFAPLGAHGRQGAISLLASHPLLRRATRNITLSASYTELHSSDRQDAVGAESDSRQHVASLGVTADFRDTWFGGGQSVLQTQVYAGDTSLRTAALAALDAAPGGLGVAGRYTILRLRAQRVQVIDANSNLTLSILAQAASRNLDPGIELAIGGPDAVRAYPSGELFADQGRIVRVDYRRAVRIFESMPTVLSAFVDHARVQVNRNPLPTDISNKRSFGGYGLAVTQDLGARVTLQGSLAWRATARPAGDPDRRPRVLVSLVAQF